MPALRSDPQPSPIREGGKQAHATLVNLLSLIFVILGQVTLTPLVKVIRIGLVIEIYFS